MLRPIQIKQNPTYAKSINDAGAIAGYFTFTKVVNNNEEYFAVGFVRNKTGAFTTVNCPQATTTIPVSMNNADAITGTCSNPTGTHGSIGFVYTPKGAALRRPPDR